MFGGSAIVKQQKGKVPNPLSWEWISKQPWRNLGSGELTAENVSSELTLLQF